MSFQFIGFHRFRFSFNAVSHKLVAMIFSGMERKLSLGSFPDVSLVQARRKRDEAKAELDDGIDPVEETLQVQTPPRTLAISYTDAGEATLPSKAAQIR
ncbi:Arm DNA-binding domain-containing protein [Sphingomonas sp. gentR]|uniref:Arm DNA-binding domain-containing protein n=1 Tax=unclassified Sphingomonas TaxID=196159 RepID=UPI0009726CAF|nr:Arm DNA-binding domain-containing protein [Sphingomonas sp. LK11]APX64733.1 hypothetical protein AV944_01455 [Sphingomonas sp. LK11]